MSYKLPESWTKNIPVSICRECREKKQCRYIDPYEGGLCLDCRPFEGDPMFTIRNWTPEQLLEFLEVNGIFELSLVDEAYK